MKKFLKDLERELKKLKMSSTDIEEIIADHAEMIQAAINDGVSEAELDAKFGDPKKVAEELSQDALSSELKVDNNKDYTEVVKMKGYDLFKAFNVVEEEYNVNINLVSEDIKFYVHEGDQIEVFAKGNTEKYQAEFEKGVFVLSVEKGIKLFGFRTKETKFAVRVPKDKVLVELKYNNTSGDAKIYGLSPKEAKFNAVSGDFKFEDVAMGETIINTVSGDAEMKNISCDVLNLRSVSGDFEMEGLKVEGELKLKSVSGDFEIRNAEAGPTRLDSVSGDLEGREFYPSEISMKTISGDVKIQNSDTDRPIDVTGKKSMSGDIKISGTIE